MNLKLITNGSVSACMHAVPHGLIYESCLTRKLSVWFFVFFFYVCVPDRWRVKSKYSRRKTDMVCLSHPMNTNSYIYSGSVEMKLAENGFLDRVWRFSRTVLTERPCLKEHLKRLVDIELIFLLTLCWQVTNITKLKDFLLQHRKDYVSTRR